MIKANTGIDINHNRIQRVMNANGISSGAGRRWKKKNWVRYEREHSNDLWHTDWHQIKKGPKVEGLVADRSPTKMTPPGPLRAMAYSRRSLQSTP
ncbi:MAG: hypothetical protein QW837_06810 [Conexivisphaerales archaeon]